MDNLNSLNIKPDILIHSNNLRNNNSQKRKLKEIATEILKTINDELHKVYLDGGKELNTQIPITFDVSGVRNKDCQRIIWSTVIKELEKQKYRVTLEPTNKCCKLEIKWFSAEDEREIERQINIIKSHMKKTN